MKNPSSKKSTLLTKYSLQYEKKPRSRVFAPLAESYRKLGMYDEALDVLRSGIKFHPDYTLGYIILSHVYFDKEQFEVAYSTLRPFVGENLENITLQKLFSEICLELGLLDEALQALKGLLLINPKDEGIADQVKLIEDDLIISYIPQCDNEPQAAKYSAFVEDDDDWVQVNFNVEKQAGDDIDNWKVRSDEVSPIESFKSDIEKGNLEVSEHNLDDSYYYEEHDNEEIDITSGVEGSQLEEPIITHTLVNLYCSQGYFEKALELLDNIIDLHPDDKASLKRREEIISLSCYGHSSIHDHGHEKLLDIVESTKIESQNLNHQKIKKVETMLGLFAKSLKERSTDFIG